jgi:hypothetical protein
VSVRKRRRDNPDILAFSPDLHSLYDDAPEADRPQADLMLNRTTARSLGLGFTPGMVAAANEVME